MIETNHKPGNLSCVEARELLSDLIDARRGEIPHPDGTPLAQPGMRAAAELHLSACETCREELTALEETGLAFAEFNVGELPAQHFANYGAKARALMARENPGVAVALSTVESRKPRRRVVAAAFAVSSLAAAAVAFSVMGFLGKRSETHSQPVVTAPAPDRPRRIERNRSPLVLDVVAPRGPNLAPRQFTHNLEDRAALRDLEDQESRSGFLVFGERTQPGESPLLGVFVRTARDQDRETKKAFGPRVYSVKPGSPAAKAELKPNDCIWRVDEERLDNGGSEEVVKLFSAVKNTGSGNVIHLMVVRPHPELDDVLLMSKEIKLGEDE